MIRTGVQFHWQNNNYHTFDDFLASLSSRKRKTLRKERQSLYQHGITFHQLTGADITSDHWDRFYQFYLATIEKKWGGAYLTEAFFHQIGASMAEHILLVMAEKDGQMIAGALNFIGQIRCTGGIGGVSRNTSICILRPVTIRLSILPSARGPHHCRGRCTRPAQGAARLSACLHLFSPLACR